MLLNVKTEYNYLQSLCKIDELIDFAVKKNCHQLGMVDDNSLTGVLKFINKCKEKNIKPIIGTKLTIENFYGLTSIIVYALNEEGLERINYLISIASINSPIKLADLLKENLLIVFDELKYFKNEDFINTIIEFLQKYKFDNYYIVYNEEYREINEQFKNEMSEKTIFLPEVRYMNDNDIDYFLVLNSLYNKTKYLDEKITKLNKKKYSGELVLKSYEQLPSFVAENMSNFIRNFSEYSLTTNYEKTLDFTVFNNIDFNKKLTLKLEKLLIENNNLDKEQYIKRLRKELKIIEKLKFQNYFLIMEDIVNFCQKENIIYGDGRGSAPGSLVAYLLKITKIDPIEYNLYFERFLNEQRSSLPDIDLDVSDIRRNEIITYLIEKYGDNHVAKIVTINKYLAKSALNDIGKSLDIDSNTLKKINSKIDSKLSFEENIKNNYAFFSPYLKDSKFDFLRQTLEKLENLPRNPSIHAAGVIISSTSIYKSSPIINNVVYNEAFYLEKYGYVKFDLLALSTLTFLDEMEKDIQLQDKSFKIENISLNNKTVFNSFANAQTFGIFQLESEGIKSLLTKYKPQNILDISIIISLYRPGPMKNIDLYLSNKNSPNRIKYLHPKLEPILKSTNGIIIFQEQIMEIVKELANFTNIEADIFRVAVSKKKLADLLTQKEKFIKQGIENGIDEKILERIYDNILEFANYGFNKAHALSYATLIYKLMYIKAIYPEIFYAKIFSKNVEGSHKNTLLKEIYSINLQILAPNILYSTYKHKTKNKTINLGLQQIKNISSQKLLNFIDRRNAYLKINNKINFTDFIINVFIPSGFMNNEIENFINSGAFDIFYTNHKSLIQTIEKYNENMEVFLVLEEDLTFVEIEDYTYNEKIILEKKALGFNLNYDEDLLLLQRFKKLYPKLNTIQNIELANNYTSSFIIAKMKKKKEIITKNNQLMAFFTFEINHFDYEFICFPEEYKNYKTFQTKDKVILEFAKNNQKAFILKNILDLGEKMKNIKILAIESSCDETSIAIVENGKNILAHVTNTQIEKFKNLGGVVPEMASRMHADNIFYVYQKALEEANLSIEDIDAIAVTQGPGLIGSLLVGINFAKTLALLSGKKLIAVNHLHGHIYATNIEENIEFPHLSLIVSGGHTELVYLKENLSFQKVGSTLDDSLGESYDKVARLLKLPYPGGPEIDSLAQKGNSIYELPYPKNDNTLDFSFSGIKSATYNLVNTKKMKNEKIIPEDIAASFQEKVMYVIDKKFANALKIYNPKQCSIVGGVSANSYIRNVIKKKYSHIVIPNLKYTTDNAAMIGVVGYFKYLKKDFIDPKILDAKVDIEL